MIAAMRFAPDTLNSIAYDKKAIYDDYNKDEADIIMRYISNNRPLDNSHGWRIETSNDRIIYVLPVGDHIVGYNMSFNTAGAVRRKLFTTLGHMIEYVSKDTRAKLFMSRAHVSYK